MTKHTPDHIADADKKAQPAHAELEGEATSEGCAKPTTRDLVKAEALIAAELDRSRARVEKLERVREAAVLVRKRDCDYRAQGEREVALDAALAECEEVDRG